MPNVSARHANRAGFGRGVDDRGDRPLHEARQHHRLETASPHRVVELLEGLLRGEHRDDRHRRHAIGMSHPMVGVVVVEAPTASAPGLLVGVSLRVDADGRIQDGEVDPELVEPPVHQIGELRGREVEPAVAQRLAPERWAVGPASPAFCLAQAVPLARQERGALLLGEALRHVGTAGHAMYSIATGRNSTRCPSESITG